MRTLGLLLIALAGCHTSPIGLPIPDGFVAPDLAGHAPDGFQSPPPLDLASSSTCNGRVPQQHRPSAPTCPMGRGAGAPDKNWGGECTTDSDCTQGKNGRCIFGFGHPPGNYCSYDSCFSDADCTDGLACDCRDSASSNAANVCVPAGCHVDSDCGPCGFCSLSNACLVEYQCHTTSDLCLDDGDCPQPGPHLCAWDGSAKRWSCQSQCPPPPTPMPGGHARAYMSTSSGSRPSR
jgi:hypothetical protein